MNELRILEYLFATLPSVSDHHSPTSQLYALLKPVARREIERLFSSNEADAKQFEPFGNLALPYHKMGAVDSLNLFDLDELIIFSFYWMNRKRYRRVLDAGANIGLHSILLSKCGFDVRAYEPDPKHFELLQRNLELNGCPSERPGSPGNVQTFNAAISSKAGVVEFVRVLGNTTGSHIAGSKPNPYGDLERFPVRVESIRALIGWADLMKVDVEGHETEVLLATDRDDWSSTDALIEVQHEGNAALLYEHFTALEVRLFSQKNSWRQVGDVGDMPTSYHEGTLFVTCKREMPWS